MADQTSGLQWVPDACTLPTAERPLRVAEFRDLFAHVADASRVGPTRLRLVLAGDPALEATARALAARETACCSFFSFDITGAGDGRVTMEISVPEPYVPVLDGLAALARSGF